MTLPIQIPVIGILGSQLVGLQPVAVASGFVVCVKLN